MSNRAKFTRIERKDKFIVDILQLFFNISSRRNLCEKKTKFLKVSLEIILIKHNWLNEPQNSLLIFLGKVAHIFVMQKL